MTVQLHELETAARYARERYQLHRAQTYGPRLSSSGRLRDLEMRSKFAESRLQRAKGAQEPAAALS
jgi:hypothetical protein